MIGAPDMAFPRMNNLSFWLLPTAFICLMISFFVPGSGDSPGFGGGWVMYPPLSTSGTPGPAFDFIIIGLLAAGFSSIFGAINFITTIFNMRAPGMTMHKCLSLPGVFWSQPSCFCCLCRFWQPPCSCCSPTVFPAVQASLTRLWAVIRNVPAPVLVLRTP